MKFTGGFKAWWKRLWDFRKYQTHIRALHKGYLIEVRERVDFSTYFKIYSPDEYDWKN